MLRYFARYFWSQGLSRRSFANFSPEFIRLAAEYNHLKWGRNARRHIRGKDVLDLGCGHTLHSVGFLAYGARSYFGIDPGLQLDEPCLRRQDRFRTASANSSLTLNDVARALPAVRYAPLLLADLAPDTKFDVIFMHNVTEHLMEIDEVFAGLPSRLRPGGKIIYRHHNYACWNGHHQRPRTLAEIVPGDAQQEPYLDWAHLDFDPQRHPPVARNLNRIRPPALRAITEKYFDVIHWRFLPSKPEQGAGRLTDAILARHPGYDREELLTQAIDCVAVVKPR
jgi:SAM-dependent methyltransferase